MIYLLDYKRIVNYQHDFIIGTTNFFSRAISGYSIFLSELSIYFFILFALGIVILIKKRMYSMFLIIISLPLVYMSFQVYPSYLERYFFNTLIPVIFISCLGFYHIVQYLPSRLWKNLAVFIIGTLILISANTNFFMKIEIDEKTVKPHLETGLDYDGYEIMLYGSYHDIFAYKRFYNYHSLVFFQQREKNISTEEIEYIIFIKDSLNNNKFYEEKLFRDLTYNNNIKNITREKIISQIEIYKIEPNSKIS
jgi:hypothetical protein